MKKSRPKRIMPFVLLLIVTIFLLINITNRYAYSQESGYRNYASLKDRYDNDEDFRFFANLFLLALASLVIFVIIASILGIEQLILWSFVGGFLGTSFIEFLLDKYTGLGFGMYSFFASFTVGIFCAIYAHKRNSIY